MGRQASDGRRQLVKGLLAWLVTAAVIGVATGGGTVVLAYTLALAAKVMAANPLVGWLLPLAGLLTVAVYKALRVSWHWTTNEVVAAARGDQAVPAPLGPAIIFGTTMTDMFGGSAGQEAATLGLGGAFGSGIGRWAAGQRGLADVLGDGEARGTFVLCGMAGAFAALLFAPLCSTLFVIELARTHADLRRALAVFVSACCGYLVSEPLMPRSAWFEMDPLMGDPALWGACLAAMAAATVAGVAYMFAIRLVRRGSSKISRPFVRILAMGLLVVLAVNLFGLTPFTGPGDELIRAGLHGEAATWDFAGKLLVTALCIGGGFKGGELTPSMAIGACAGCTVGHLLGSDPTVCAAVGLVTIFSATTNTPIGSFLLGIEAFGLVMAPLCAVAALVGFLPTVRLSLYECNQIPGYRELWGTVRQTFGALPHWQ